MLLLRGDKRRENEMELKRVPLSAIKPYPGNPRINDDAVDAVAESIRQCGYCAPIVVDENMVILAGHTRHKALTKLGGYDVCEVCVIPNLTDEKKKKYRILDNKTNELAGWDFMLLEQELEGLDFEGFDFGFSQLRSGLDVTDEDFLKDTEITKEKKKNEVQCPHCGMWFEA